MDIHTFELCAKLTLGEYQSIRNTVYQTSREQCQRCFDDKLGRTKCARWSNQGILFILQKSKGNFPAHYLYLVITPALLLGNPDPTARFTLELEQIQQLVDTIEDCLSVLPCSIPFEGLYLCRVDLCQDRIVENQAMIFAYMELLNKGHQQQGWQQSSYGEASSAHAFRRFNTRYQVTVYDKLHQLNLHGKEIEWDSPQRILRVETALLSDGIRHYIHRINASCSGWTDSLCLLGINGYDIMCDILNKLIPPGDYYSLDAARSIISQASWKAPKRQKVMDFLHSLTHLRTIDKQSIADLPNGRKRWEQLLTLNINPATIPARTRINHLPSLYPSLE